MADDRARMEREAVERLSVECASVETELEAATLLVRADELRASLVARESDLLGYALRFGAGTTGTARQRCLWLSGALNSALCEADESEVRS